MAQWNSVSVLAVSAALFLLGPSPLTAGDEIHPLLTSADLARERRDHAAGPALSSTLTDPHPWKSYNQWMCFESDAVDVGPVEIDLGSGYRPWPQLSVKDARRYFYFSPETDIDLDAQGVLDAWKTLINKSRQICVYAAFLQDMTPAVDESHQGLWVLSAFKTENGYWKVEDATRDEEFDESAEDQQEDETESRE